MLHNNTRSYCYKVLSNLLEDQKKIFFYLIKAKSCRIKNISDSRFTSIAMFFIGNFQGF